MKRSKRHLRKPGFTRAPVSRFYPLPSKPGRYFWNEWQAVVEIYQKGRSLFVLPPGVGGIPVKITPMIAGDFVSQE